MLPTEADCDDCMPDYMKPRWSAIALSSLPFILSFLFVATAVSRRLFPLLSGNHQPKDDVEPQLPTTNFQLRDQTSTRRRWRVSIRRLAALTFSTNIALSAVLVELLLCEISNAGNPVTRSLALRITLSSLLFLLILTTPALELHSIISSAGWSFSRAGKGRLRVGWILEALGLAIWLVAFWYIGSGLLGSYFQEESYLRKHTFSEGCLARIGVIGIALMASLAGFAAVSSLWQTFGVKTRLVTESDISRKQAGLNATNDMLDAKRSRLRALRRKISETPEEGFMTRMIGSIRGNAETQERRMLELEISGLETMRMSLSNSVTSLQSRRQGQLRSASTFGRLCNMFAYGFSLYCLYRIGATTISTLRRFYSPNASFSDSDPINNVLALWAKHWDPTLNRAAWSRQISFLLSGVMLLASFNSVLQTFLLFARLAPGIMQHAQANLALLISQISATYVISSALLLRSNLPREVRSVITDALGAPLEPVFVEKWFESWFLAVSALTAFGIWIGRKVKGGGWDDDDDLGEGDVEMGKMS